jgi:adenosylmethionine-8-amino-7-oxononanoate aminotransferase
VAPDVLCVSKALTGGYLPLSATLASDEIYSAFLSEDRGKTLFHGHSYTGNALACAVALEALAVFQEEGALARVASLEKIFAERLTRLADHTRVAAVRGIGGMAAVELRPEPERSGEAGKPAGGYFDRQGPDLGARALDRGVLLRPLGNVVYTLPPYVVTDGEAHRIFDVMEEILEG